MIHFVTHFDRTYSAQGRCMLDSLAQVCRESIMRHVVWCGSDRSHSAAGGDMSEIGMCDLAAWRRLKPLREKRQINHWFWSLEPAIADHFLNILPDGDILTYVDADQYFFSDPIAVIQDALSGPSIIALSPHYFPVGKEKGAVGKFNYGIGCFRVCDETRSIAEDWLDQVIEKCDDARNDQHYLSEWPEKYGNWLAELPITVNCGPWQIPEITSHVSTGDPMIEAWHDRFGSEYDPLVSFHFHEFRRGTGRNPITLKGEGWNRTNYELHPSTIESVYTKYEAALSKFL